MGHNTIGIVAIATIVLVTGIGVTIEAYSTHTKAIKCLTAERRAAATARRLQTSTPAIEVYYVLTHDRNCSR